jgi:hypothetical protein
LIRRTFVGAMIGAAILVWGGLASTQESGSDIGDPSPTAVPVQVSQVVEQAAEAQALLREHHARVVQHNERVEQTGLAHQEYVRDALGDRAPTETVAPMATVPPMHTVPPPG